MGNTQINYLFLSNEFSLKASYTELIVFSKTKRTANTHMVVDNVVIGEKESIKYLEFLTFQKETKHIIKIGAGVKTNNTKKRTIPDNMRKLNLIALVLSHIHYSATIIQSINQNLILTLERQLN